MRYAKIENGKVENVIELEYENIGLMPTNWLLIQSDVANIGDDYIDGEFVTPKIEDQQ